MSIILSEGREQYIRALVQEGRYASENEVIDEALRLLRQQEEAEQARVIKGIQDGIDDMHAGRHISLKEFGKHVRTKYNIPL